jgi:hypothetical protein
MSTRRKPKSSLLGLGSLNPFASPSKSSTCRRSIPIPRRPLSMPERTTARGPLLSPFWCAADTAVYSCDQCGAEDSVTDMQPRLYPPIKSSKIHVPDEPQGSTRYCTSCHSINPGFSYRQRSPPPHLRQTYQSNSTESVPDTIADKWAQAIGRSRTPSAASSQATLVPSTTVTSGEKTSTSLSFTYTPPVRAK